MEHFKMNREKYEQRTQERRNVVATQIDILNDYDPQGNERRMQEFYEVLHRTMVEKSSEDSATQMDEIAEKYTAEINHFKQKHPELEKDEGVRGKLRELERLSSSFFNTL